MKIKDFIEILKPCAQDAELDSVIIGRDSNGEETIDVICKDVEINKVEERNSSNLNSK